MVMDDLITEFLEEDPEQGGLIAEEAGQFLDPGRIGEGGYSALPASVAIHPEAASGSAHVRVRRCVTAATQRIGPQLRNFLSYRLHFLSIGDPKFVLIKLPPQ